MTKRLLFAVVSLLAGFAFASAQSLDGMWIADEATKQQLKEFEFEDNMELVLNVEGSEIIAAIYISEYDPEVGTVNMIFGIPGTYKRSGNDVKCTFDRDKLEFDIVEFNPVDAEMKELMESSEEMKNMVISMIKAEAEGGMKEDLEGIKALADVFEGFHIDELAAKKLAITIEDTDISLSFYKE